jgi:hypothetical protein
MEEVRVNDQLEYIETLLQCQICGNIHIVKAIQTEDGFVKSWCGMCHEITTHLDIKNENDKYLYMNINIDPRCY